MKRSAALAALSALAALPLAAVSAGPKGAHASFAARLGAQAPGGLTIVLAERAGGPDALELTFTRRTGDAAALDRRGGALRLRPLGPAGDRAVRSLLAALGAPKPVRPVRPSIAFDVQVLSPDVEQVVDMKLYAPPGTDDVELALKLYGPNRAPNRAVFEEAGARYRPGLTRIFTT